MKRYFFTTWVLSSTLSLFSAHAAEEKQEKFSGEAVNFSAKDVWEVDNYDREDHKILVIQDRKYNKAGRLELGVDAGTFAANPFYTSYSYGFKSAYHFTEYLGLEGIYNWSKSSLNKHGTQISEFLNSRSFSSTKEFREPKWFSGAGLLWSPIYGKFALFRAQIVYFDFYSVTGLSVLKTNTNVTKANGGSNQVHMGSLIALGMRVFLSKSWLFRFDARQAIYQAKFAPTSPGGQGSKVTLANYQFTLGASYLINIGGF